MIKAKLTFVIKLDITERLVEKCGTLQ